MECSKESLMDEVDDEHEVDRSVTSQIVCLIKSTAGPQLNETREEIRKRKEKYGCADSEDDDDAVLSRHNLWRL